MGKIPPYFNSNDGFVLYHGDTNSVLNDLSDKVDMIFADPPYFLSNMEKTTQFGKTKIRDKGEWDRIMPLEKINEFNRNWLLRCKPILKENGTIWVSSTYHNIFSIEQCLLELGFKILNIVVWQKIDPPPTPYGGRLNFSAEYLIWARKNPMVKHCFHYEKLKQMNGGREMPDVWRFARPGFWERTCGKHPTQKPLRLLYRILQVCTEKGFTVLDPFSGSCTTGIAANLLHRSFIGIDMNKDYLDYGIRRKREIENPMIAESFLGKMAENPDETMVMVNHVRKELKETMIEKGICYLRAGNSQGSLLITPGFDRMQYILLHTGGRDATLFKLKNKGAFQIWTAETLKQNGFCPQNASYYFVYFFDNRKPIKIINEVNLIERINTYRPKIRPLSEFIGIN